MNPDALHLCQSPATEPYGCAGRIWKDALSPAIEAVAVAKAMFGKSAGYIYEGVGGPEVIRGLMTDTAHSSVSLSHTT